MEYIFDNKKEHQGEKKHRQDRCFIVYGVGVDDETSLKH